MEAVFLILIGAALFSQSWHLMGLYSDGRTVGIFIGGLGVLSLAAVIVLDPMLLTGSGDKTISAANHMAEVTATKALIAVWGLYCIGVAGAVALGPRGAGGGLFQFDRNGRDCRRLPLIRRSPRTSVRGEHLARSLRRLAASDDHFRGGVLRTGVHV